jgi:hypothetical protein
LCRCSSVSFSLSLFLSSSFSLSLLFHPGRDAVVNIISGLQSQITVARHSTLDAPCHVALAFRAPTRGIPRAAVVGLSMAKVRDSNYRSQQRTTKQQQNNKQICVWIWNTGTQHNNNNKNKQTNVTWNTLVVGRAGRPRRTAPRSARDVPRATGASSNNNNNDESEAYL